MLATPTGSTAYNVAAGAPGVRVGGLRDAARAAASTACRGCVWGGGRSGGVGGELTVGMVPSGYYRPGRGAAEAASDSIPENPGSRGAGRPRWAGRVLWRRLPDTLLCRPHIPRCLLRNLPCPTCPTIPCLPLTGCPPCRRPLCRGLHGAPLGARHPAHPHLPTFAQLPVRVRVCQLAGGWGGSVCCACCMEGCHATHHLVSCSLSAQHSKRRLHGRLHCPKHPTWRLPAPCDYTRVRGTHLPNLPFPLPFTLPFERARLQWKSDACPPLPALPAGL